MSIVLPILIIQYTTPNRLNCVVSFMLVRTMLCKTNRRFDSMTLHPDNYSSRDFTSCNDVTSREVTLDSAIAYGKQLFFSSAGEFVKSSSNSSMSQKNVLITE